MRWGVAAAMALSLSAACAQTQAQTQAQPSEAETAPALSMGEILDASPDGDWRALDPENTMYLELPQGRVVIALAPEYAPNLAANLRTLARAGYFDGASIIRAQDNYVVQWAWPESDPHPTDVIAEKLEAEFDRPVSGALEFTPLPDGDVYAPEVGFSNGFPVARGDGRTWLAHCYGMVGAGRAEDPNSGNGVELYAVIGHGPRHLDRNVVLVGRVVDGIELLSTMPRGTGPLSFYESGEDMTPVAHFRMAADVPEVERTHLEMLRTDSASFAAMVESRRNRVDPWFVAQAGAIELCNVPLPVRARD